MKLRIGLERFMESPASVCRGKRVGLLAHAGSVNRGLIHAKDLLWRRSDLELAVLFGPEHGIRGELQDQITCGNQRDDATGLIVHSLYGDTLRPTREMLAGIDALVVDLQDVGARYYTYVYTLAHCMEACGEEQIPVVVLDRPNPIGGRTIEGNILEPRFRSFVGRYPIPVRHGMTIGELAGLFREYIPKPPELIVVGLQGWSRGTWFDQTNLPWVMPSPNMPTLETATVYPGACLFEGTNLSEGRGTTRPFELFGAPWIDPVQFRRRLEAAQCPGVRYRETWFQPTFQKHAGKLCGGVQVYVHDRDVFQPYLWGLEVLSACLELYRNDFAWREEPYEFVGDRLAIDLLTGCDWIRRELDSGITPRSIARRWQADLSQFNETREAHLLY